MVLAFLFLAAAPAPAEETLHFDRPLKVGVEERPPFAMKNSSGEWIGISVDLWRKAAAENKIPFEWREVRLDRALEELASGTLDVGLSAITVTEERSRRMDFSHPYFSTGLAIAVPWKEERPLMVALHKVFTGSFMKMLGVVTFLLLICGILVWRFERGKNPGQFGGPGARGLSEALWWSACTMSGGGYGDRVPLTGKGRIAGVMLMFASILTISLLTASLASSLTMSEFRSLIHGPEDLHGFRVGCVSLTTSEKYMKKNQLKFIPFPDADKGLASVASGKIDAFVFDEPMLRYLINLRFRGKVMLVPGTFDRQDYAIALVLNSPLRRLINQAVLKTMEQESYDEVIAKHLKN